ncbi:hypothetical protein ODJ79_37770 [Actinoplanes sp. KI2]|uniref:hypothetical protein n=1 Tax=Actinoplanes sp. KI2 TaxID=2983315 RepID=UPI0021D60F59|nr:hypothetical protein [Actinoplanes sp. KI2]MCU7729498.1 hypothetical protein [Actinoplanes sp. KI2]
MLLDPAGFSGADVLSRPAGRLDLGQRARLAEIADRVQVAHDLLLTFADRYAAFPRLAEAQEREVRLLRDLLRRYPAGRFGVTTVRDDYDHLLARGNLGRAEAARAVAEALHRVLVLLDAELPHASAPDVHDAYTRLSAATIRQLQAVQGWCPR